MRPSEHRRSTSRRRAYRSKDAAAALPRKVRVSGVFDPAGTVYLDSRMLNGVAGFYVITPLVIGEGLPAVLIDRGWKAHDMLDRARIAAAMPPSGRVTVEGLAVLGHRRCSSLAANPSVACLASGRTSTTRPTSRRPAAASRVL